MTLLEEKLRLAEMSVNEVIETLQDRGEGVQLKASEMLRQQQEEIEALKAENKKYEKHIAIGYLEELK
jgi:TusA-related sulfurtransferase